MLGPSKVLTDKDACESYARDESEATGVVPDAVVLAENADDILAALSVAREAEVPITPRSGGTGRTGGSVPVELARRLAERLPGYMIPARWTAVATMPLTSGGKIDRRRLVDMAGQGLI